MTKKTDINNTTAVKVSKRQRLARRMNKLAAAINMSHIAYGGLIATLAPHALAGPDGGVIVGGQGNISQKDETTLINQASSRMAINWDTFNIDHGEQVNFIQPSSSSVVLNNILDQSPSQIHGQINANGHVVLVNPRGILFTETSAINVGAITASGLGINPTDFMNGDMLFKGETGSDGTVINRGLINASSVALVGKHVVNDSSGFITADVVSLAAADEALLTFDSDGMIGVKVTKAVMENEMGVDSAVLNSGAINGQQVLMKASVSKDLFTQAVNNTGTIKARGIDTSGGKIMLFGSGSSVVNSGTLDASGSVNGGSIHIEGDKAINSGNVIADGGAGIGGDIKILGDQVEVVGNSKVSAQGDSGGGEILIGGDYKGENPEVRNAINTTVDKNAILDASGNGFGDGGKVIVWSDGDTYAYGYIDASSGILGGDGGFIETSGKKTLYLPRDVSERILASAHTDGNAGLWLLDPEEFEIHDDSNNNIINGFTEWKNGVSSEQIENILNNGTSISIRVSNIGDGSNSNPGEVTVEHADVVYAHDLSGDNKDVSQGNFNGFSKGIRVASSIEVNLANKNDVTLTLETLGNAGITVKSRDNDDRTVRIANNSSDSNANKLNIVFKTDGNVLMENAEVFTAGGDFTIGGLLLGGAATNVDISSDVTIDTDGGHFSSTLSGSFNNAGSIQTAGGSFTSTSVNFINSGIIDLSSSAVTAGSATINVGIGDVASVNTLGNIIAGAVNVFGGTGIDTFNFSTSGKTFDVFDGSNTFVTTADPAANNTLIRVTDGDIIIAEQAIIDASTTNLDATDSTGKYSGKFALAETRNTDETFVEAITATTDTGLQFSDVKSIVGSGTNAIAANGLFNWVLEDGESIKANNKFTNTVVLDITGINAVAGASSLESKTAGKSFNLSGAAGTGIDVTTDSIQFSDLTSVSATNATILNSLSGADETFALVSRDNDNAKNKEVIVSRPLSGGGNSSIGFDGIVAVTNTRRLQLTTKNNTLNIADLSNGQTDIPSNGVEYTEGQITFSGVKEFDGGGGEDTVVGADGEAWALNENHALSAFSGAGLSFTGVEIATNTSGAGAVKSTLTDNGTSARSFTVEGANSVSAATTTNNSLRFDHVNTVTASSNTADSVAFGAAITAKAWSLTGDSRVEAGNITFSNIDQAGAAGDNASVNSIINTAIGRTWTLQQDTDVATSGSVENSGVVFSGITSATQIGDAIVTGSSASDAFAITSYTPAVIDLATTASNSVTANGIGFSNVVTANLGSNDTVTDTIANLSYSELKTVENATDTTVSSFSAAGIGFTGANLANVGWSAGDSIQLASTHNLGGLDLSIDAKFATLLGSEGNDLFTIGVDTGIVDFTTNNQTVSFSNVTKVDALGEAAEGQDKIEATGADWQLGTDKGWVQLTDQVDSSTAGDTSKYTIEFAGIELGEEKGAGTLTTSSEVKESISIVDDANYLAHRLDVKHGSDDSISFVGMVQVNLDNTNTGSVTSADTVSSATDQTYRLKSNSEVSIEKTFVDANNSSNTNISRIAFSGLTVTGADTSYNWGVNDRIGLTSDHSLANTVINTKGAELLGTAGNDLFVVNADTGAVDFTADGKKVIFSNVTKVDALGEAAEGQDKIEATGADWQLGTDKGWVQLTDQVDSSTAGDTSKYTIEFAGIELGEEKGAGTLTTSSEVKESISIVDDANYLAHRLDVKHGSDDSISFVGMVQVNLDNTNTGSVTSADTVSSATDQTYRLKSNSEVSIEKTFVDANNSSNTNISRIAFSGLTVTGADTSYNWGVNDRIGLTSDHSLANTLINTKGAELLGTAGNDLFVVNADTGAVDFTVDGKKVTFSNVTKVDALGEAAEGQDKIEATGADWQLGTDKGWVQLTDQVDSSTAGDTSKYTIEFAGIELGEEKGAGTLTTSSEVKESISIVDDANYLAHRLDVKHGSDDSISFVGMVQVNLDNTNTGSVTSADTVSSATDQTYRLKSNSEVSIEKTFVDANNSSNTNISRIAFSGLTVTGADTSYNWGVNDRIGLTSDHSLANTLINTKGAELLGTAGNDLFVVNADTGAVDFTADGKKVTFSNVTKVDALGEAAGGHDKIEAAGADWTLNGDNNSVQVAETVAEGATARYDILFNGVELAEETATGTLTGSTSAAESFTLENDGTEGALSITSKAITFSGIDTLAAGDESDTIINNADDTLVALVGNGSAAHNNKLTVTRAVTDKPLYTLNITGADKVTGTKAFKGSTGKEDFDVATIVSAGEDFNKSGISFEDITSVDGNGGGDTVTGVGSDAWLLTEAGVEVSSNSQTVEFKRVAQVNSTAASLDANNGLSVTLVDDGQAIPTLVDNQVKAAVVGSTILFTGIETVTNTGAFVGSGASENFDATSISTGNLNTGSVGNEIAFSGITSVDGAGGYDIVTGADNQSWGLTASGVKALTGTAATEVEFKGIELAQSQNGIASLTGTAAAENYAIANDAGSKLKVTSNGIAFTGITQLNTMGSSAEPTGSGAVDTIAIDAGADSTLVALVEVQNPNNTEVDLQLQTNQLTIVRDTAGDIDPLHTIKITGVEKVTGTQAFQASSAHEDFDVEKIEAGTYVQAGITFADITSVDGNGDSTGEGDTATGTNTHSWNLTGLDNSVDAKFTDSTIRFTKIAQVTGGSGVLNGTSGIDTFTLKGGLNAALTVESNLVSFDSISTINAGTDSNVIDILINDSTTSGGSSSIQFELQQDVDKNVIAKQLLAVRSDEVLDGAGPDTKTVADTISITGIDSVTGTGKFVASSKKETFDAVALKDGTYTHTDADITFAGITHIDGNGGDDSVTGATDQTWNLTAAGVEAQGIEFSGVATATNAVTDAANGGTLNGLDGTAETYVLGGGTKVTSTKTGIDFQNITKVNAGSAGSDSITGSATQQWDLVVDGESKRIANAVKANSINFTGIETATSATSTSSGIGGGITGTVDVDAFTVDGTSRKVAVSGITFENISVIDAGSDTADTITSSLDKQEWQLAVDNETDNNAVNNKLIVQGITVKGIDQVVATNAKIVGSSGDDSFVLLDRDGNDQVVDLDTKVLLANGVEFNNVASVDGGNNDAVTSINNGDVADNRGDTLTGLSGQKWQMQFMTADGQFYSNSDSGGAGITFNGIEVVDVAEDNASLTHGNSSDWKETFSVSSNFDSDITDSNAPVTNEITASAKKGQSKRGPVIFSGVSYLKKGTADTFTDSGDTLYELTSYNSAVISGIEVAGWNSDGSSPSSNLNIWQTGDTLTLHENFDINDFGRTIEANGAAFIQDQGDDKFTINLDETVLYEFNWNDPNVIENLIFTDLTAADGGANGNDVVVLGTGVDSLSLVINGNNGSPIVRQNAVTVNGVTFSSIEEAQGGTLLTGTTLADDFEITANGFKANSLEFTSFTGNVNSGAGNNTLKGSIGVDNFVLDTDGNIKVGTVDFAGITGDIDGNGGIDTFTGSDNSDTITVYGDHKLEVVSTSGGTETNNYTFLKISGDVTGGGGYDSLVVDDTVTDKQLVMAADDTAKKAIAKTFTNSARTFTGISKVTGASGITATAYVDDFAILDVTGNLQTNGIELVGITGDIDGAGGLDTLTGSSAKETFTLNSSDGDISVAGSYNFLNLGGAVATGDGADDILVVGAAVASKNWTLESDAAAAATKTSVSVNGITFSNIAEAQGDGTLLTGTSGDDNFAVTAEGITANGIKFSSGKITTVNAGGQTSAGGDSATGLTGQNWSLVGAASGGSASNNAIAFTGLESATSETAELIGSAVADTYTVTNPGQLTANGIAFTSNATGGFTTVTDAGTAGIDHLSGYGSAAWDLTGGLNNLKNAGISFTGIETASSSATGINGSTSADSFTITTAKEISANGITITSTDATGFTTINGGSDAVDDSVDVSAIDGVLNLTTSKAFTLGNIQVSAVDLVTADSGNSVAGQTGGSTYRLKDTNVVIADDITISGIEYNGSGYSWDGGVATDGSDSDKIGLAAVHANITDVDTNGAVLIGSVGDDAFAISSDHITLDSVKFTNAVKVDALGGTEDTVQAATDSTWSLTGVDYQAKNTNQAKTSIIEFSNIEKTIGGGLTGSDGNDEYDVSDLNELTANKIAFSGIESIDALGGEDTVIGSGGWTLGDTAGTGTSKTATNSGIVFKNIEFAESSGTGSNIITGSNDSDQFTIDTANDFVTANDIKFSVKDSTASHGGITQINAGAGADDSVISNTDFILNGASKEAATGVASVINMTGIESASGGNLVASDLADTFVVITANKVKANEIQFSGVSSVDAKGSTNGLDTVEGINGWTLGTTAGAATDKVAINSLIEFSNIEVATSASSQLQGSASADTFKVNAGYIEGNGIQFSVTGSSAANGGMTKVIADTDTNQLGDIVHAQAATRLALNGDSNQLVNGLVTFTGVDTAHGTALDDVNGVTGKGDTTFTLASTGDITANAITFKGVTDVDAKDGSDTIVSLTGKAWLLADNTIKAVQNSAINNGVTFNNIDIAYGTSTLKGSALSDTFTVAAAYVLGNGIEFSVKDSTLVNGGMTNVDADTASASIQDGDTVNAQSGFDFVLTGTDYELENNQVTFTGIDTAYGTGLTATDNADEFTVLGSKKLKVNAITFNDIETVNAKGSGSGSDSVIGLAGADWQLVQNGGDGTSGSVDHSDISFTNIDSATGSINGADVSTVMGSDGKDSFEITASGLKGNDITFSGIDTEARINAGDGYDTLAALGSADVTLTGENNEADTGGYKFSGIDQVLNGKLYGSDNNDTFDLRSGVSVSANNIDFSSPAAIDAGLGDDTVISNLGWTLGDLDGNATHKVAINDGIEFLNIEFAEGTNTVTGSAGNDTFAVTKSGYVKGNGIEFRLLGKTASDAVVDADTDGGIDIVNAGGGDLDQVTALGATGFTLLGDSGSASNGGIVFNQIEKAIGSDTVTGSGSGDSAEVTGDGHVSVNGIAFSAADVALSVDGGIRTVNLGNNFGDKVSVSASLDASSRKWKLDETANNSNKLSNSSMNFTGVYEAIGAMEAGVGSDTFDLTGGEFKANNILFSGLDSVDGGGGSGIDTVISDTGWTLGDRAGNATSGSVLTSSNSSSNADGKILFTNIELAQGLSTTVTGSAGDDDFVITGTGHVKGNDIAFSTTGSSASDGGIEFINAGTGSSPSSENDSVSFDDAVAGSAQKFVLTGGNKQTQSHGMVFSDLETASGGTLTGSATGDTFVVTDFEQVKANGVQYTGLDYVDAIGLNDNATNADSVTGAAGKNWQLNAKTGTASNHGITFDNIEQATAVADSGADKTVGTTLIGTNSTDNIAVTGDGLFAKTIKFSGISVVDAGTGGENLAVSSGEAIELNGEDNQAKVGSILFKQIDTASGAELLANDGAKADEFVVGSDGKISANKITFSGLTDIDARGGDADSVIGFDAKNWTLVLDDKSTTKAASNNGIIFRNIEIAKSDGSTHLAGSANSDQFTVTNKGYVEANGIQFSVVGSSASNGGLKTISGGGGEDSLNALASSTFTITGANNGSNEGINFSAIKSVAADSVAGTGDFTVTGSNKLTSIDHNMNFTSVDSLLGNGTNTVNGVAGQQWQLVGSNKASQLGINFNNIENFTGSNVTGTAENDTITVQGANKVSSYGMNFSGVNRVDLGDGNTDKVVGSGGWELTGAAKTANNSSIQFAQFEIADGVNSALTGSAAADIFAVSNSGVVMANDIQFSGLNSVNAGGGVDTVTADARSQWTLNGSKSLSIASVAFSDVEQARATNSSLLATAGKDVMTLDGAANLGVAGIQFTGVTSVDGNGGGDTIDATGASWSDDGSLAAAINGVSVIFTNIDTVLNTGVFNGSNLDSVYSFSDINSMKYQGVNFSGVQQLNNSGAGGVLQGSNLASSWNLNGGSGTVSSEGNSLTFSGLEQIDAGSGADTVTMSSGSLSSLSTGSGEDIIYLNGGRIDVLDSGNDNDRVVINNADSAPAILLGGSGQDSLEVNVSGLQWRVIDAESSAQAALKSAGNNGALTFLNGAGPVNAVNYVGDFAFNGFENLANNSANLDLYTTLATTFDTNRISFNGSGMVLTYNNSGDVVLDSRATGANSISGTVVAKRFDVNASGDVDIDTALTGPLRIVSTGSAINIDVSAEKDLLVEQVLSNKGSIVLSSKNFGDLSFAEGNITHLEGRKVVLGTPDEQWVAIGDFLLPPRIDAEELDIFSFSYVEPIYINQVPVVTATGDKLESLAGAQASQGLKSAVQNAVEDFAQVDPAIFDAVSPYSIGVDALFSPDVRLVAGVLLPTAATASGGSDETNMSDGEVNSEMDQPLVVPTTCDDLDGASECATEGNDQTQLELPQLREGYPESLQIEEGNTLWEIAEKYLQDPLKWPELWKQNPQVKNPNLIYPGDVIKIVIKKGKAFLTIQRGDGDDSHKQAVGLASVDVVANRPDYAS